MSSILKKYRFFIINNKFAFIFMIKIIYDYYIVEDQLIIILNISTSWAL